MKPIIFFQVGPTQSSPWHDLTQTWNFDVAKNGYWFTPTEPQSYLFQFNKSPNNILFCRQQEGFALTKPFIGDRPDISKQVSKLVDIDFIISWLDKNENKSLGYGSFMGKAAGHVDIIQSSVFFTREPWMGGHLFDVTNNAFVTSDTEKFAQCVTWFFAYKARGTNLYFVFFNPSLVNLASNIEGEFGGKRFRTMDPHMTTLSYQLLKPKLSKNCFPISDFDHVVYGDTFTVDVGKLGTIYLAYEEEIDSSLVRVFTDLNVLEQQGNKYTFSFKDGQYSSFLSIRMNTGTSFDWSLMNSQNRLVYNINIRRFYD